MARLLTILSVVNVLVLLSHTNAEQTFFVQPTDGRNCKGEQPCHTLQTYLENMPQPFVSNTTIHFLGGIHAVNWPNSTSVFISNVSDLEMTGPQTEDGIPLASIHCNWNLEFCFSKVKRLTISNIEFKGCGFTKSHSECPLTIKGFLMSGITISPHLTVPAALKLMDSHTVTLNNVSVQSSYKYGMVGINVLGLFLVSGCTFNNNSWGQANKDFYQYVDTEGGYIPWEKSGGNVLLLYDDTVTHVDKWHGLKLNHSRFSFGTNYQYCSGYAWHQGCGGAGVGIFIKPISPSHYLPRLYIVIEESEFHDNIAETGANLLVAHDYDGYKQRMNVYIQNCTFRNGRALSLGGGVEIYNGDPTSLADQVRVVNTKFVNNSAQSGGGMGLVYSTGNYHRLTLTCIFIKDCTFTDNIASKGAAIYAELSTGDSASCINILGLSQTEISYNVAKESGGGINIQLPMHTTADNNELLGANTPRRLSQDERTRRLVIRASVFNDNKATRGSAISISACDLTSNNIVWNNNIEYCTKNFDLLSMIQNTNFTNNSGSPLYLNSIGHAKVIGSRFFGNPGGGILANQSDIYVEGKVVFAENTAITGGAIHLACNQLTGMVSRLFLLPDSEISILNNSANFGGGISANEQCSEDLWCFFQLTFMTNSNLSNNINDSVKITLINNLAATAGDSLFGGPIDDCYILTDDPSSPATADISFFHEIFNLSGQPYTSSVASYPYRVCFCMGRSPEDYCLTTVSLSVFRGEQFHVSAIISGRTRGAYSASVRTRTTSSAELGPLQAVQQLDRTCGNLNYSLRTSNSHAELQLSVERIYDFKDSPTVINVTLLPCPFGFEEVGDPPRCDCLKHLSSVAGVTCNVNTQTVSRPGNIWIGNYSGGVVAHLNCPFDYCKQQNSISLKRQDEQCAFNRSGILCGKCEHGLGIALGTSKCLSCSDLYLFIFIPVALVGLALLVLLLKSNLTVSVGSINGLIFYANIIQANKVTFFPQDSHAFVQVMSVFISWVNLDLGIETCFYKRMDAYAKAWLQFVFPVYVWIVILLLVYTSRYSVTVSRITGSNAVPVLATLLLLSYSKLLRTVITAISPISITDKDGKTELLWLADGNVPYLTWPHAALFSMALIALLVYIIPLTLLVLFGPRLQSWSNWTLFVWVHKLKPLLDAYQGPYKDKYRYWTGIMLVIRLIMFTVFSANSLGDPKLNLLCVSLILMILLVVLWNIGIIYKKYTIHLLEVFYILNLSAFSVITLYFKGSNASQQSQQQLVCTMVGCAFFVFLFIMIWHLYTSITSVHCLRSLLTSCYHQLRQPHGPTEPTAERPSPPQVNPQPTTSVIDMNVLRESLLTQ